MIKTSDLEAAAFLVLLALALSACETRNCPPPDTVCTWPMDPINEDLPETCRDCES